jgi:transcriptional regulator with XRE-family HTH domain
MKWTETKDAQLMRYLNIGLSYSAIARRMGITKNSAISRAHRIRRNASKPPKVRKARVANPRKGSAAKRPYVTMANGQKFYLIRVSDNALPIIKEIVRILNERHITLSDYCYRVGCADSAFSRYRAGHGTPSVHMLEAMLNALGLTIWCKAQHHPQAITNGVTEI